MDFIDRNAICIICRIVQGERVYRSWAEEYVGKALLKYVNDCDW